MNTPISDIELIERYFDNELSDQETAHLKIRLTSDLELKKLFEREKLLINTIRFNAAKNNLTYLKQVERSIGGGKSATRYLYYLAAAACAGLLVLAGIYLPMPNQHPAHLYADYFAPHPNIFEPTLRGGNTNSIREEAFHAYEQADYQKAAELFTKVLQEKSESQILLLLGNSNLMLGKTEEAKKNFTELISRHDDLDLQAKWFLSLCYLKNGEVDQARKLLKELGDTDISYAEKAKELLKKFD
jgi:tetratricopeptide (TPR) repeat protein